MYLKSLPLFSLLLAVSGAPQEKGNGLPVLFQFSQPTHSVSVFRGAELKNAIAKGLVKGFGSLGGAGSGADREGKSADGGDGGEDGGDGAAYVAPVTQAPVVVYSTAAPTPAPTPAPTAAPVIKVAPAPVVKYAPAPAIRYAPAPAIRYAPAPVIKYAPAPVIKYAPKPAYQAAPSYVEPVYAQDAQYTWEYSVLDDYTANNFGAKESRSAALTNGKYYAMLPDGRLQTVTYVVDGDLGYVPTVEYSGDAQYPVTTQ